MKYFIFFSLFSVSVFSAVPNPITSTKNKILTIKANLAKKTQKSLKLRAKITSIENNIVSQNNSHVKVLKEITAIEESLAGMKQTLDDQKDSIAVKKNELKKWITEIALTKSNTLEFAIKKRLAQKEAEKTKKELNNINTQNNFLASKLNLYETQLRKLREREETLISLIKDLENDKQSLAKNYLSNNAEKSVLENKLNDKKVELINKRKTLKVAKKLLFSHPLASYDNLKKGEKGVTYFFQGEKPILASAAGRVIYTGELSTYGQVIMIDHGKGLKSVMLGNLSAKVSKGNKVSKGELVAYTRGNSLKKNKLYFELRKANRAQDTYKWLE